MHKRRWKERCYNHQLWPGPPLPRLPLLSPHSSELTLTNHPLRTTCASYWTNIHSHTAQSHRHSAIIWDTQIITAITRLVNQNRPVLLLSLHLLRVGACTVIKALKVIWFALNGECWTWSNVQWLYLNQILLSEGWTKECTIGGMKVIQTSGGTGAHGGARVVNSVSVMW